MVDIMRTEHFFGKNYHFIWSDNWYIEDNNAWFIAGEMDILFSVNLNTKKTTLESEILSDKEYSAREHPRCLKKGSLIICLPCNGKHIWCYHLMDRSWTTIAIDLPEGIRSACFNAWFIEKKLYVISLGLKQIIEIDINKEEIIYCHDLPFGESEHTSRSILVGNCIYIFVSFTSSMYKFDCLRKKLERYDIPDINDQIQTICFDGDKFWLSGEHRRLYIWDEKIGQVFFIENLPNDFGIWNFSGKFENLITYKDVLGLPLFSDSVMVGQYIWFIPFQTNEILYVEKNTMKIKKFHINEENHTDDNIKQQLLGHKYLLEYVREDRYIGLFSLKNTWIFEIDCKELSYKIVEFQIGKEVKQEIENRVLEKLLRSNKILHEQEQQDLSSLINMQIYRNNILENKAKKNGKEIYDRVEK